MGVCGKASFNAGVADADQDDQHNGADGDRKIEGWSGDVHADIGLTCSGVGVGVGWTCGVALELVQVHFANAGCAVCHRSLTVFAGVCAH